MSYEYFQGCEIQQKYFDSALFYNPLNSEVYFQKATWAIKIGSYIEFFKLINEAVRIHPEFHLGYRGWIKLYNLRDYQGAINDLNLYQSFSPNNAALSAWGENVNMLIGIAYKQLRNYSSAIHHFNQYISSVTKEQGEDWVEVYAFVNRGICKYRRGEFEEAIKDFNKAILYHSNCPEAYYWKGISHYEMGNHDECLSNLNKALEAGKNGYLKTNPYKEVFDQITITDIQERLNEFKD